MKADLHMHSVHSDGTYTVEELIKRAKEKGLTHIALTDHDSVAGVEEAVKYCKEYDIELIKGLELSTRHNDESVHILGYFLNGIPDNINEYSKDQFVSRHIRAKKMCELLRDEYNLNISYDLFKDEKGMITRGNLARALMSNNDITEDECRFYLSSKSKAYVEAARITTKEGIEMLKSSGAITVLAHPTLLKKNKPVDIIKLGVDGLEGFYPLNQENEHLEFIELAKEYNLFVTAGSDFHGKIDKSHKDMATVFLTKDLFKRY